MIEIVKAAISVTLPIVCSRCGRKARSLPIRVDVADCSLHELTDALEAVRLGTAFPVGWAKFYGEDSDKLVCLTCLEAASAEEA